MMRQIALGAALFALSGMVAEAATLRVVAVTGDVAPGTGGATYASFNAPALNDVGETAFRALLTGGGVTTANNVGIFTSRGLAAREGDVAPGTDSAVFISPGAPALNNTGETAFTGLLSGAGVTGANNGGIFTTGVGLVAREGDVAPGTGGATYSRFDNPALNDAGETAFRGFLSGVGVTMANDSGIFASSGLVAREGDESPDTAGATYSGFGFPVRNEVGETAFRGFLSGAGVTGNNNEGIFTSSGLVAREGDVAPGTGGATYSSFVDGLSLNDAGKAAFQAFLIGASVTGANNVGIFTDSGVVAREGNVAPGTGGATFSAFGSPALNNAGETAFSANLTGAGVTGANNSALFLSDRLGEVSLLAREGDVLDLGAGDQRTLNTISFFNGLNAAGDVAFLATFTDFSSAILVLEADGMARIPVPGSLPLLLAGLAAFGLIRRRTRG